MEKGSDELRRGKVREQWSRVMSWEERRMEPKTKQHTRQKGRKWAKPPKPCIHPDSSRSPSSSARHLQSPLDTPRPCSRARQPQCWHRLPGFRDSLAKTASASSILIRHKNLAIGTILLHLQ